ncbi:MFS transporter [Kribbella sp. CA-253562]|uniref:MFS transporter n=1 Tax=Kribbella sp. CA-253562 TaxID=3239942 RepID=UPI003D936CC9
MRMRATLRDWTGLAVLALPCSVVSMDASVLNLAVPQLTATLRPTGSQQLWIVDSYVFVVAGLLITMGMVGDRFGRRRLLLIGASVFAAASVLAAFAVSPGMLIATRVLLGVAGATLMPSTLALIRTMFADPRQRRTALGVWTASFALGGLAGPVVGGLLLTRYWWGSVFLVAVPVMLLLLATGPFLLPEYRGADRPPLDLGSAALSLAAVLAVVYGLKRIAESGPRPAYGVIVLLGIALAVWFVRRQQRLARPMIELRLFRSIGFSGPLVVLGLIFFVLYGTQFITAQLLQLVLGLSALEAGLVSLPGTIAYLLGSLSAPLVAARVSTAYGLAGSLLISAAGFGLLTQIQPGRLWIMVTGFVVFSVGLAGVYLMATDLTVSAAPPERAGTTSALVETSAELGGALGIAGLGSIVLAVYRHSSPGSGAPGHTPQDPAATTAYLQGYQLAEALGAAALLVAAAVTAVLLRPRTAVPEPSVPRRES